MGCRCSVYAATHDALTMKRNGKGKKNKDATAAPSSVASSRHVGELSLFTGERALPSPRLLISGAARCNVSSFLSLSLSVCTALKGPQTEAGGRGGPPTVHTVPDRRRRPLLQATPRNDNHSVTHGASRTACVNSNEFVSLSISLSHINKKNFSLAWTPWPFRANTGQ